MKTDRSPAITHVPGIKVAVSAAGSLGAPAQRASGGKTGIVSQKAKAALQTPSTKSGSLQKAGNARASPPPLRKAQLHKGIKAAQPFAANNAPDEAVREDASAPLLPGQVVHIEGDRCVAYLFSFPAASQQS